MQRIARAGWLALLAAVALTLGGCEAVEDSARELTGKAADSARELAQESLQDSLKTLNEQVDKAQQSAEALLGMPPDETPPKQAEEPPAEAAQDGTPTTLES